MTKVFFGIWVAVIFVAIFVAIFVGRRLLDNSKKAYQQASKFVDQELGKPQELSKIKEEVSEVKRAHLALETVSGLLYFQKKALLDSRDLDLSSEKSLGYIFGFLDAMHQVNNVNDPRLNHEGVRFLIELLVDDKVHEVIFKRFQEYYFDASPDFMMAAKVGGDDLFGILSKREGAGTRWLNCLS